MLEPCDAKVSSTVLRGLGDRKVARLLGNVTSERLAEHPGRFKKLASRAFSHVDIPSPQSARQVATALLMQLGETIADVRSL